MGRIVYSKILKHKLLITIVSFYLFFNLINLTLLPIFNDESIYLNWGLNTHIPGHLYDSLSDAKQPLIIWLFGIFEGLFRDPLFAGRFTSVIIGALTATGVYEVTKKLLNKNVALISSLLYSISPIFVFYNRQALMEAGVACIGIWSFNVLLSLILKPSRETGIILGIILGLGFFTKVSSFLFFVTSFFTVLLFSYLRRNLKILSSYFYSIIVFLLVNLLLIINPLFWETLWTNNRYSYSLKDLLTFPFNAWLNNLLGFFEIGFVFLTPVIFVSALIGIFLMIKNKVENTKLFFIYFCLALLLEIFLTKFQQQRYLVPFLPFLIIPAAYVLSFVWKGNIFKKILVILFFLIPLAISLLEIFNPKYYIEQLSKVSRYSELAYTKGQTSGYGINETIRYIKEHSVSPQPTIVFIALNAGNPEAAISLYSQKDRQFHALYIDRRIFPNIDQYKCLSFKYPAFFITRNDQLAGMNSYFNPEKFIQTNDNDYKIGIYVLEKNCKGSTLSLMDTYRKSLEKLQF